MTSEKYIENLKIYNWEIPRERLIEFQPISNPTVSFLTFNSYSDTYNVGFKDQKHDYTFRIRKTI